MATKKITTKKKAVAIVPPPALKKNYNLLIKRPRITEKATMIAAGNVYTFNVDPRATKTEIMTTIKTLYKVTPVKVNMITIKQRNVIRRGKKGKEAGGKKALVYLKKGDKIEFI